MADLIADPLPEVGLRFPLMTSSGLDTVIADGLNGRWLLDHPFYQRWERGKVSMGELGAYAAQYRHFEAYLPAFLTKLVGELTDGEARDLIAANLADEQGNPIAHIQLFERFADAVGAPDEAPSPAAAALVSTYAELFEDGPVAALAGFVAYESQASAIARRKADGLRQHYGLSDLGVSFWEHHADVDTAHAAWAQRAVAACAAQPDDLVPSIRRSADAWWAFLDEREALAAVG